MDPVLHSIKYQIQNQISNSIPINHGDLKEKKKDKLNSVYDYFGVEEGGGSENVKPVFYVAVGWVG